MPATEQANAYDVYLAAHDLLHEPARLQDRLYRPPWRPGPGEDWFRDDPRLPLRRAEVEAARDALNLVRGAVTLPYRDPSVPSYTEHVHGYMQLRRLALVLECEACVLAARGDLAGALSSLLDTFHLANDVATARTFLTVTVGIAICAIGRRRAWLLVDRLPASVAADAARRLSAELPREPTWRAVVDGEDAWGQAARAELFGHDDWRETLRKVFDFHGAGPHSYDALRRLSPEEYTAIETAYHETLRRSADGPYRPYLPPRPRHPAFDFGTDTTPLVRLRYLSGQAMNRLLAVRLAVHARHAAGRPMPRHLDELVPEYLPDVPLDPFSNGEPLCCAPGAGELLVWSRGPDGVDDRGMPASKGLLLRRRLSVGGLALDTKGDLLMGVNVDSPEPWLDNPGRTWLWKRATKAQKLP